MCNFLLFLYLLPPYMNLFYLVIYLLNYNKVKIICLRRNTKFVIGLLSKT